MVLVQPSQDIPGHDHGGLGLKLGKGKKVRGHEPWQFQPSAMRHIGVSCRCSDSSEGVGTGATGDRKSSSRQPRDT